MEYNAYFMIEMRCEYNIWLNFGLYDRCNNTLNYPTFIIFKIKFLQTFPFIHLFMRA